LIVVSPVAESRRIDRVVAHGVFPLLVEESVKGFATGVKISGGTGGQQRHSRERSKYETDERTQHGTSKEL
jgi:hypothetical protein